eukprot:TRINITY_DN29203_c0_g1_i1.p1 TRINITY_DN29203_c0_g1~~TRINITY_DN29203_c0_g1_i1.p1  ORF type:complete len:328 (+),score=74.40 TRINITY_DN29203_c0_g1_i1:402-1385(+)
MSNVRRVVAIDSSLVAGRTVKMRLHYAHPGVSAVAKFPQLKFPYEAYGEYTAFEVDRLLGVGMVPPTAWAYVPVSWIEAAAAAASNGAVVGNAVGGKDYAQWVATELLEHALRSRLVIVHPTSGRTAIGASVQLWLADVHPQQDTDLSFPPEYRQWFRDPASRPQGQPRLTELMRGISGMLVLDTVIGNKDRSASKNAHVAGGCSAAACPDGVPEGSRHRGPSALVLLDQGKSWYEQQVPDNGPFRDAGTTFCAFRRDLHDIVQRLANAAGGVTLVSALSELLPAHVYDTLGTRRIQWGQERLIHLAGIMRRCIAEKGEELVFGWAG